MKILFVCSQGKNRSPTAAKLFSKSFETKSVGLFTSLRLPNLDDELSWADYVFTMEEQHRQCLIDSYGYNPDKVFNLDIPDGYPYNSNDLKELLIKKITPYFKKE